MSYEQARALVAVENELERERQKAEQRGVWTEQVSTAGGSVELLLGVLGKLFR